MTTQLDELNTSALNLANLSKAKWNDVINSYIKNNQRTLYTTERKPFKYTPLFSKLLATYKKKLPYMYGNNTKEALDISGEDPNKYIPTEFMDWVIPYIMNERRISQEDAVREFTTGSSSNKGRQDLENAYETYRRNLQKSQWEADPNNVQTTSSSVDAYTPAEIRDNYFKNYKANRPEYRKRNLNNKQAYQNYLRGSVY